MIKLFDRNSCFFILENFETFDAIIGRDFLKLIGANIDLERSQITYNSGIENLQFFKCKNVNYIDVKSDKIPENVKENFKKF